MRLFGHNQHAFDYLRKLHIRRQIPRFLEVSFDAQTLSGNAICFRRRRSHDDYRRPVTPRAPSQFSQDFDSGNLRQVEIQKHQRRTRRVLIPRHVLQILQCVLPVIGDTQPHVKAASLQHFFDDERVRRVIFNQQYCVGPRIR